MSRHAKPNVPSRRTPAPAPKPAAGPPVKQFPKRYTVIALAILLGFALLMALFSMGVILRWHF